MSVTLGSACRDRLIWTLGCLGSGVNGFRNSYYATVYIHVLDYIHVAVQVIYSVGLMMLLSFGEKRRTTFHRPHVDQGLAEHRAAALH